MKGIHRLLHLLLVANLLMSCGMFIMMIIEMID